MASAVDTDNSLITDPAAGLASVNATALSAIQSGSEACLEWQREIGKFFETRLVHNQQSLAALLSSSDLAHVVKVQQEWGVQAATDYVREAARFMRLITTLSLTGTTPAVQGTANINA
jgi:hypothetical protein